MLHDTRESRVPDFADEVPDVVAEVFDLPEFSHYATHEERLSTRVIDHHLAEIEDRTGNERHAATFALETRQREEDARFNPLNVGLLLLLMLVFGAWIPTMLTSTSLRGGWAAAPSVILVVVVLGTRVVWRRNGITWSESQVSFSLIRYQRALRSAVEEAISKAINEELGPEGIVAFPTYAPRLVELSSSQITPSRTTEYVNDFIHEHEASAVGLAGIRGSGKSTVMRALHADKDLGLVAIIPSPVRYEPGEFIRLLLGQTADAIAGQSRRRRLQPPDIRLARELLRDLRWETEHGHTGKSVFKISSWFEAGSESSLKYKRRDLSRSDLVTELRKLLTLFATRREHQRLIVCIDELDKIDTVEHLVDIVNELKDLFHLDRVHFVVAVSTDALAAFEKRGLSTRDAFDSAFDVIVETERLTLDESLSIVQSRATGFAPLIAMFCHAWSGGLPRELLRAARTLVTHQRQSTDGPLSLIELVEHLIRADLDAAIRASMRSLDPGDPQITSLWHLQHADKAQAEDLTFDTPVLQALHAKTRLGISLLRLATLAQKRRSYWDMNGDIIDTLKQQLTKHALAMAEIDAPQPVRDSAVDHATGAFNPAVLNP